MCFFCIVAPGHSWYWFLTCPIESGYMKVHKCNVVSINWCIETVFAQLALELLPSHVPFIWDFLQLWGLWHNWCMRNKFVFKGQFGVQQQIRKLKGCLLWQFYIVEKPGRLCEEEMKLCKLMSHQIYKLS